MKLQRVISIVLLGFWAAATVKAEPVFQNFITARDGQLLDGEKPYRFISWNIPNLLVLEDRMDFATTNAWCLPDQFEITDALATVVQMGGTVVRTYSIAVVRGDNPPPEASYVLGPGKFNEAAFRTLDTVLKVANEQGVRLVIPLVNNWPWMGGRGEYAGFRGKTKDDFWTDPQLIADFEETIKFVLTRTNTLTGVRYLDDKAILCWETGNEVRCPASWTQKIAAYIKSLDAHHLVMDGYDSAVRPGVLAMPEVDIVTTHLYPGGGSKKSFGAQIRDDAARAKGKKVYVAGEFGFAGTDEMKDALQAINDSSAAGGLLWSLRYRNRDGGFYWHSEPSGGNRYKAFHWPGSPVGEAYDEIALMKNVREQAFAIRGLSVPKIPAPQPPKLLSVTDAAVISWQGSVGAQRYQVERAAKSDGTWQVIATNVDEATAQYHPQFADENVPRGEWFYRVRAVNEAGLSRPSNVVGPDKVTSATLVDELADFLKVSSHPGNWQIVNRDCRAAREDAYRAAGSAGDALIYKLPSDINGFVVFAFFPKNVSDIKFSFSSDGVDFHEVRATMQNCFNGAGDYDYWQPVRYQQKGMEGGRYLKIEPSGETQIGRVEISRQVEIK